MPFKCARCGKVVQSMDQAECECANPFFIRCALIHYIHTEGPGEVFAKSYKGGGYTDWFLPSKEELNILFLNRAIIGGFGNYGYWSSTEASDYFAWSQAFVVNGSQYFQNKNSSGFVRAIRSF